MAVPKKRLPTSLTDRHMAVLSQVFSLLADKNRFKIVLALAQTGEMHVTALCELVGQTQPAVSHHLSLLRTSGLVAVRRDGKFNFYSFAGDKLADTLEALFTAADSTMDCGEFSLTFARTGKR